MKCKIRWLLSLAITLTFGCGNSSSRINLFFNPSLAFDLNEISVRIKIDNKLILDTLIINNHIDKSLFLKGFSYVSNENKKLEVEINGKNKIIKLIQRLPGCNDIFLKYDDHSLIFEEIKKIELNGRNEYVQKEFRQLFDSIKSSSGNKYHRITFSIKEGECNRK